MPVSRRSFLRSGTTAVLATAAALQVAPLAFAQPNPSRVSGAPAGSSQTPLASFNRVDFEPHVGGKFLVGAGAHALNMTLTKVNGCELSARGRKLTKKMRQSGSFILVFSAAGELSDLTTIHNVEHRAFGKFPLFLTRRDNPAGGYFYEAVFNHA